MTWRSRLADGELVAALDGDARLITLHGLGGSGTSSSVERALRSRERVHRVDLGGCVHPAEVRARLRGRSSGMLWLDQVHRPSIARDAIDRLLERSNVRVVVAARAPLGSSSERRIPLELFDVAETRALVFAELRRLGAPTDAVEFLAHAIDGWPLAVRAATLAVRTLGPGFRGPLDVAAEPGCGAVLAEVWRSLDSKARELLVALSFVRSAIESVGVVSLAEGAAEALLGLRERRLLVLDGSRIRLPRPLAAFVRARAPRAQRARGESRYVAFVLGDAERERAAFRADPVRVRPALERLAPELATLAGASDARISVRATLALEPLLIGRLDGHADVALWASVMRASKALEPGVRAEVTLARVRALIAYGEHESAERLLMETSALSTEPLAAAYRAIYLAHIFAWRGRLDEATAFLDEAMAHVAKAAGASTRWSDVKEDALVQRIFVAYQGGDLDETERLCRQSAAESSRRPSPRVVAIARRFAAEVMIRRGEPARAVVLLARTRDEFVTFGDEAGALFIWSRLVEALRAAGEIERAADEAQAASVVAARAELVAHELALLRTQREERVSVSRVAELAWQVEVAPLRADAERWLAERPLAVAPTLRLDRVAKRATLDGRSLALAHRATLWRILDALVRAHRGARALSCEDLFAIGWPSERAEPASRRKRVQTAVWSLRRALLGNVLSRASEGYALSQRVRIESS